MLRNSKENNRSEACCNGTAHAAAPYFATTPTVAGTINEAIGPTCANETLQLNWGQ